MRVHIKIGDVLNESADILVASANPFLNLSGGVGGALLERCGPKLQDELWRYLAASKQANARPGTVVCTSAFGLPFKRILHVTAIDAFYDTSVELVRGALSECFETAIQVGAMTLAMPALATGYGRLPMQGFGAALRDEVRLRSGLALDVTLVLRTVEDDKVVRQILGS